MLATKETGFVAGTVMMSFAGGYGPAMQSLSLGLMRGENGTGKLFGGLSVMQSIW